jgi:serine/threonine protein kinase
MGEVYRARDTKLGRDVALKILPEAFANDAERLARFEREAKLLASLNHPNIAAIYGLEQDGSCRFLVLELVEGEDLSKRLAKGPLSVDEALPIAAQICDALENAHDQGVIHRDLKPGNVVANADGDVKVLDFGLAKALDVEASGVTDLSQSPTIMTGGTIQGVILGTAAYMSPEQARGKRVDRRADIWAFGCVLFDMLTGEQAFSGETVSDTLASVLAREPEWDKLPANTTRSIDKLLRRCLTKDPKQRLRDIGEARIIIDSVRNGAEDEPTGEKAEVHPAKTARPIVSWALAAVFAVVSVLSLAAYVGKSPENRNVIRAMIPPPDESSFELSSVHPGPVAISRDGTKIAFTARNTEGAVVLWTRPLDDLQARPFPGTEGAGYPFWSPDGRSIGFFANAKLKRVDASGGPPLTLCDAPVGKGGSWSEDDVILFAPSFNGPIHRVSAAGGESTPVTEINPGRGENSHRFPVFMPGGKNFVFFARATGAAAATADASGSTIYAASLDGGEPKNLFRCQSQVAYASGHLLFVRENALMARPFDPERLEFKGDAFPIVDQVNFLPAASRGIYDASQNGSLVYLAGAATPGSELKWLDRSGKEISALGDLATYDDPAISPDGKKVAVVVTDPRNSTWDVWVYEAERGVRTRFTFGPTALNGSPVWAPDGGSLLYRSDRAAKANLYAKAFAGSATEELILDNDEPKSPTSWSNDGESVLFTSFATDTKADVWIVSMTDDADARPLFKTEYMELMAQFSPDGKWIAYTSDESGRFEVYVVPFPGPGRKWQVSSAGGLEPRWRADGGELYFQTLNNQIMAVALDYDESALIVGAEEELFQFPTGRGYDVAADGQTFLVVDEEDRVFSPLTLVVNWTAELEDKR